MKGRVLHVDTGCLLRGGQRQVLMLMTALRVRGWDSVLAAPAEGTLTRRARAEGFSCIPFNPRNDLDLHAAWRLHRAAERQELELWHAHSARAHGVAGLARAFAFGRLQRRLIVTRRTAFKGKDRFYHRLKYQDRGVERYIAISEAVAAGLQKLGVAMGRVRLVPSAVDADRFRDAAYVHTSGSAPPPGFDPEMRQRIRGELGLSDNAFLVGAAGALDISKGFDTLIEAASQACVEEPALHFVVAGEGPERANLEATISRLALDEHCRLLGRRKDMPRLMAAFDLFCMPSREEGLGSAVLEAFAAGVPVLGSDAGGLAELLQSGKTGHRVSRDDPQALARALVSIYRDPAPARAMARHAWEHVRQQFGSDRMAEAVERIYDSRGMNGGQKRAAATAGG